MAAQSLDQPNLQPSYFSHLEPVAKMQNLELYHHLAFELHLCYSVTWTGCLFAGYLYPYFLFGPFLGCWFYWIYMLMQTKEAFLLFSP